MSLTRELDGFLWPAFFPEETYHLARNLPLRPEDIVVSTYPKCGTNWVAYIILGILNPEEPAPDFDKLTDNFAFVDLKGLGRWADSPQEQGRTLLTHLPFDRLQTTDTTRFVGVIRNPMDCCVSYYHFTKAFPISCYTEEEGQEIPTSFFKDFAKGNVPFGNYFNHIKTSYDRRNDNNVHLIIYEQMKANPREETLKLAKFLGAEKALEANGGKLLDKIVQQSSFDNMKKRLDYKLQFDNKSVNMLRKGEAGGYKESLTSEQIDILKKIMEKELSGTELLRIWRNI